MSAYLCVDFACSLLTHDYDPAAHRLVEIGPGRFSIVHVEAAE